MSQVSDVSMQLLLNSDNPVDMFPHMQSFQETMMYYECAMMEVETKLKVLNSEFALVHKRNPFESIKSRLKKPNSIMAKLRKKELDFTIENLESGLTDIAGVRVICSFLEDIYALSDMLSAQDDITVLEVKDYIRTPKRNGYRSLHLIVEVPIFLTNRKKYMKVEVQFRTIAMDFWASLDHKLKYKKDNLKHPEIVAQELKKCADTITAMDYKMQEIRQLLE